MIRVYSEGTWDQVERKNSKGDVYSYQRFRIYYKRNGKNVQKNFYGKTKIEAKRKFDEWKRKTEETPSRVKDTVVDVARAALDEKKDNDIKETTYDFYAYGIKSLEKTQIGTKQIRAVDKDELQKYINGLKDSCTLSTIKRQKLVLKMAFDYALDKGFISDSPMGKVKVPNRANITKQAKESVALTVDQRRRLEDAASSKTKKGDRGVRAGKMRYTSANADAVVFLLHTGLRFGELRALEWKNVDKVARRIRIKQNAPSTHKTITTTKREASVRAVPLDDRCLEILNRQEKNGAFVFHTESGEMIHRNNVDRTLKSMLKISGLEEEGIKPTLHDLRHTYATELLRKGISPKKVQKVLGHSDIQTTLNIYAHVFDEDLDDLNGLID